MPFKDNIHLIKRYSDIATNKTKYANQLAPDPNYPNLVLFYPGKLTNHGDYKLEFYGTPLTHPDIVRAIHQFTLNGQGNGLFMANFLVDIFLHGLNAIQNSTHRITVRDYSIDMNEFKHLIYWIVLQEDINYPRPLKKGVRMPFWRYIEGIMAAEHPDLISLPQVIQRTNNHGTPPPPPFSHLNLKPYLSQSIKQI